jgi:hypothetical protein
VYSKLGHEHTAAEVGATTEAYVDSQIEAAKSYTDTKVAALVDSAPETLATLNELAAALGDDPNFATTMATELGKKATKDELTVHTNSSIHITEAERTTWNSTTVRVSSITLTANGWIGTSNPWSQVVVVDGVTGKTKIDLYPTATQMIALQDNDIALMAENNDGTVTVYAFGEKPTVDYTIQATLTEVVPV